MVNRKNSFIAIVLAAGLSSRMGRLKPLLSIGSKPALFRLLDSIRLAEIEQVFVITGHENEAIVNEIHLYVKSVASENFSKRNISIEKDKTRFYVNKLSHNKRQDNVIQYYVNTNESSSEYLSKKGHYLQENDKKRNNYISTINDESEQTHISFIFNPDFELGMFSSVKTGVRHAYELNEEARHIDAALLFPVDVPLVAVGTIEGLIFSWEENADKSPGFAIPRYKGKNGHPLLIPEKYFGEILDYDGDMGLKGIRNKYETDMIIYETNDAGCVLDMDTPEDYEKLIEYYKRNG